MHIHSPADTRRVMFFQLVTTEPRTDTRHDAKGRAARDVPPDERWAFTDHPTMAEITAEERRLKLDRLVESEDYDSLEAFLEANAHDSVVPGICLTDKCDYTTGVELDQDRGWCECCCDDTVASALVLAGII